MAKKEIDKVFFRMEWWLYLQWCTPEVQNEVLTRFFKHAAGTNPIDLNSIPSQPSEAERLLFPMVMQYEQDKEAYSAKCNRLKENGSKSHARDTQEPNDTNCNQLLPIATNCALERKGKERDEKKGNEKKVVLLGGSSPQTTKTKQLFDVSFFYLSKGITKPVTHYNQALDYNEAHGWKEIKANGTADHSDNKVAYLKGWARKIESTIAPAHGQLLCDLCTATSFYEEGILDSFRGVRCEGDFVLFLFDNKTVKEIFINHFKGKTDRLVRASDVLNKYGFEGKNFTAVCEK